MANRFSVQPLGGLENVRGIQQGILGLGEQMQQREQQEQQALAQQEVAAAFESNDPRAIRQAMIKYPEMAEQARNAFGFTNEQSEQAARETYRRALSDPENAAQYLQQGIEQVAAVGGRPTNMNMDLQMLQENPEAALQNMRAGYAALASEEEFGAMFPEGEGGPKIGTYNPRDYTPQSFAEFTKTGDPGVLKRYASQRSVEIGGVPHVFDPAMGGYRPAGVTGGTGARPVTAQDVAESEAVIAGAKEGAKQEVKAGSPEEQRKQQEAQREAQTNLANFQGILDQADRLLENDDYIEAIAGVSGKIPAIPGTDRYDAQVAFNQFKDSLTLGNLEKMSGVLTDRDIQVLSSAAGGIEPGMSKDALLSRLNDIRGVFAGKTAEERRKLEALMGGEQQAPKGITEQDADDFINSILGQ